MNKYVFNFFSTFAPGRVHDAAIQLPWDTIYTTNFDLLLEQAEKRLGPGAAGRLVPIVSVNTALGSLQEEDIPYYKLHGSIDLANTNEGRLTLTKEDYRHYEELRRPLFKRLYSDLSSRTFVFVGYAMRDTNFREILEECRAALGVRTLPLSYAIRPGFREAEAEFWLDKYNVRLVDATAEVFLQQLRDTWFAEGHIVLPLEQREAQEVFEADDSTRFAKVGSCFFRLAPEACTGQSTPQSFFLGCEPTWADVRDSIAPPRDLYWTLLDAIFEELAETTAGPGAYLVTGYAGTGKTTLLRTMAYMLSKELDVPVLIHIPGTPLEMRDILPVVQETLGRRLVILVHDAAEYVHELRQFYIDASKFKVPLTLLLEDRTNQWNVVAKSVKADFDPAVFELGGLSRKEIEAILDALTRHGALGRLGALDRGSQIAHFIEMADQNLLVALRELTTGNKFDRIIADEYLKVSTELARQAYLYVAALGQVDLYIRNATLLRLLNCDATSLSDAVFKPTEGILLSSQLVGRSRHTIGWRVRARHPVIASVVFSVGAPDDKRKLEILHELLYALDPGFQDDQQLLHAVVRRRELVRTLSSAENQRGIYELLAQLLPGDPYVFQHRSILERDLGNVDAAVDYARKAWSLKPDNPTIANTLGLALEMAARREDNAIRREKLLREATSLFEKGITQGKDDPFGYLGKVYTLRQRLSQESSEDRKVLIRADILSILETARESTENDPVIEQEIAREQKMMGELDDAIRTLEAALERQPRNERVASLLVTFLRKKALSDPANGQYARDKALEVAMRSVVHAPTSWRLHAQLAWLHAEKGSDVDAVVQSYEAAIRNNRKEPRLYVELAAYLFKRGEYARAEAVFARANGLPITSQAKHRIYEWFTSETGKRREFYGRVERMSGAGAFVRAIPENFEAFFWRKSGDIAMLVKGDEVKFCVGFNCREAVAEITQIVRSEISATRGS